jgi:uncharacterized protein YkwD
MVIAGCGADDDGGAARTEPQLMLASPTVATNEAADGVVDRSGAEAPINGVVEGGPDVDVLDDLAEPDLEGLAEGTESCGAAKVIPDPAILPEARQALLCLINAERTARGLGRLRMNRRLTVASVGHSRDMVRNAYFAHDTPGGVTMTDRLRRARYVRPAAAWTIGENLAWGAGSRAAPTALVDAWMASPGHRANILQPRFREIGIGLAPAAPTPGIEGLAVTATTNFGRIRLH